MLELAEMIKEVVTPRLPADVPVPTIVYKENTADDPQKRKPDITKARTLLEWEPKVALKDGLAMMIEDFQNRLGL